MKLIWLLIVYSAISVLLHMLLSTRENICVVLALLLSGLLLGHRELWSLIKHHRLPVIDERVQANLTSAMRLTGIFFFIASIILILIMRFNVFKNVTTSLVISGLLVFVAATVKPLTVERSVRTKPPQ